jgi:hypothetical protein
VRAADIFQDRRLVWFITAVIAVYVILATRAFEHPGIYMDAINPDYLAARMADPGTATTAGVLPGNLLWKRWPLLAGGLYHGSIHAYLTLPFYLVFGGTVLSLRLAHLCLGMIVVVSAATFLWKTTHSKLATASATLALVTDPGFIFTFRTQAYITTFPIVAILYGLAQLYEPGGRRQKHLFVAGLCVGAAIWGYFIYGFMIPGIMLVIAADRRTRHSGILRSLTVFVIGTGLGLLPYVVGYTSLFVRVGGVHQGLEWMSQAISSAHVISDESYSDRLHFVLRQVLATATGAWHWTTFFSTDPEPGYGQAVKFAGLVLLPVAALPLAFKPGPRTRAFWFTLPPILSYVLVASLFGGRLGGHHFCLLLPMFYVLAAISILMLADRLFPSRGRAVVFALPCVAAMAVNLMFFAMFISRLEGQGGAGPYSSIVSDYPVRARHDGDRTPRVFMDWGGLFQFIYLTEGKIPAYDGSQLQAVLCRYNDGKVVFLGADALRRGLQEMQNEALVVTGIEQSRGGALHDFQFVALRVVPSATYCR